MFQQRIPTKFALTLTLFALDTKKNGVKFGDKSAL